MITKVREYARALTPESRSYALLACKAAEDRRWADARSWARLSGSKVVAEAIQEAHEHA